MPSHNKTVQASKLICQLSVPSKKTQLPTQIDPNFFMARTDVRLSIGLVDPSRGAFLKDLYSSAAASEKARTSAQGEPGSIFE